MNNHFQFKEITSIVIGVTFESKCLNGSNAWLAFQVKIPKQITITPGNAHQKNCSLASSSQLGRYSAEPSALYLWAIKNAALNTGTTTISIKSTALIVTLFSPAATTPLGLSSAKLPCQVIPTSNSKSIAAISQIYMLYLLFLLGIFRTRFR